MMTSLRPLALAALSAVGFSACFTLPAPAPTCTAQSCANGCCTESGACITANDAAACGLNGAACVQCGAGASCASGACAATGGGGGSTGGGGGSTGGGGGSTGGGGGGGTLPDGGVDCATTAYDAVLGTLTLSGSVSVAQSAELPANVVAVGAVGTSLYGLSSAGTLHALGTLPTLSLGPSLGSVLTPADLAADAGAFIGGSLAVSGTQLLAGYTKSGAGFPGAVARYETSDGGLTHVDAPGNYTLAGLPSGFLVNGGRLDTATGAGVYVLDAQGAFGLATFETAWQASNGYTARTANGVLLLGYFSGVDFNNHVVAAPPSLYSAALTGRSSFALSQGTELVNASDLADLATLGNDAVLVRGGYQSEAPYAPYTTKVERLPLTVSGSGTQTVTAGTAVTLVNAPDLCTRVTFAVGTGSTLLLGVQDKNGRRVVQLQP
jgi:hypothetical protein